MRRTLVRDLGAVTAPTPSGAAVETRPACDYDASAVVAAPNGLDNELLLAAEAALRLLWLGPVSSDGGR
jgi:hypothetical protein